YTNKGRDILLDSYIEDKFKCLYSLLLAVLAALSIKYHFYTLVDILLSYYILIYRGNYHSIEILDLFIFKFKGKGPIYYIPLIFTMYISKQN
ncbi:hypothetical protein P154DRAFT_587760, partial [Amniculicola lignicola CBS 123094]